MSNKIGEILSERSLWGDYSSRLYCSINLCLFYEPVVNNLFNLYEFSVNRRNYKGNTGKYRCNHYCCHKICT